MIVPVRPKPDAPTATVPVTHMLAGAHDEDYERSRDWLDALRDNRRIT